MTHLDIEALSGYMDGTTRPGVEEHLAACAGCREELAGLVELRNRLRSMPEVEPPAGLWSEIEERLRYRPPVRASARPVRWVRRVPVGRLRQVVGMAAVFLIGLGIGRFVWPVADPGSVQGERLERPVAVSEGEANAGSVVSDPSRALDEAMSEVRRHGQEYERALLRLEAIARRVGTPVPQMAEQELAVLDALVEASRRGVEVEPSDPIMNAYLFAALDRRADVIRQVSAGGEDVDDRVVWR